MQLWVMSQNKSPCVCYVTGTQCIWLGRLGTILRCPAQWQQRRHSCSMCKLKLQPHSCAQQIKGPHLRKTNPHEEHRGSLAGCSNAPTHGHAHRGSGSQLTQGPHLWKTVSHEDHRGSLAGSSTTPTHGHAYCSGGLQLTQGPHLWKTIPHEDDRGSLAGCSNAPTHGHAHRGRGQRCGVIDAIPHKGDLPALHVHLTSATTTVLQSTTASWLAGHTMSKSVDTLSKHLFRCWAAPC